MTITSNRLTAAAGVCAAAAGAIFIGVQVNHPPVDLAHVVTTEVAVRETAKVVMAVLAMVGFTGLYVRHHRRLGVVGLAGYLLLMVGYLALFAVQCVAGYVLPAVASSDPAYVQAVVDEALGGPASGRIGHLHELLLLSGIGYAIGGLLFGIALFRARVVARWAAALFAYGTVSALALAMLPQSFSRPFAVPTGIALIGLGVSLWRTSREDETADAPAPAAGASAVTTDPAPVR